MRTQLLLVAAIIGAGQLCAPAEVRLNITGVSVKPENPSPGHKPFEVMVQYRNDGDDWMFGESVRIRVWKDWQGEESRKRAPKGDGIDDSGWRRAPGYSWLQAITTRGGAPTEPGKHTARVEVEAYGDTTKRVYSAVSSELAYEVAGTAAAKPQPTASPAHKTQLAHEKCSACGGQGKKFVDCPSCNRSGYVEQRCKFCSGGRQYSVVGDPQRQGKWFPSEPPLVQGARYIWRKCNNCNGTTIVKVTCPLCDGRRGRTQVCSKCGGTGKADIQVINLQ